MLATVKGNIIFLHNACKELLTFAGLIPTTGNILKMQEFKDVTAKLKLE